jgi:hypothetical protein
MSAAKYARGALAVLALLSSASALAQDRGAPAAPAIGVAADWHPYVFSGDGVVLAPRTATVEAGVGYNGVTGAGGGLQPDDARRVTGWIAGTVGIVDRVQLGGTFVYGDDPTNGSGFNQARVDLQVEAIKPRLRFPVAVSIAAGYQADALYDSAVTGAILTTAYLGRVNLTFDLRGAHYFAAGRDALDLFVTAGALVRATSWLRVGAEYVGEELEGVASGDDDASPGGRHYVGPTAALYFAHDRLRVNATGGAVLVRGQSGPLARGSLSYRF